MKNKRGYVLANVCDNCINWESPESHANTGMQRSLGNGYCSVFLKETKWDHGQQCTAFERWPTDQEKMNDLSRSG